MRDVDWAKLLDVVRQMSETRTLGSVLAYATEQALEVVGADQGYLILLGDDGALDFRVQFSRVGQIVPNPEQQVSQSIVLRVLDTGEPVVSADAQEDEEFYALASVHDLKIRSIMCLPLIAQGNILGALYIENRGGAGLFCDEDVRRMRLFASQAAVSIANAMLNEALEARVAVRTARLEETNAQLRTEIEARTQAEAALRESEERLELALVAGAHGLWDWDLRTNRVIRNARWSEMLGLSPEDVEPSIRAWELRCHAEDLARVQLLVQAHLEGRTPFFDAEYRLRTGKGDWVWVHDRGMVVERDNNGRPVRMTGTQHDVTVRKQAESMLLRAHDRLTTLQQVDFELAHKLEVNYVLRIALNAAVQLSGSSAGVIGVMEGEDVRVVHASGGYEGTVGTVVLHSQGIAGRAIRERAAVVVRDVHSDEDYVEMISETEAQMTVPLMSGERFIGVLMLETDDAAHFDDDTFNFVKLLSARIAVALDNAQAYEEIERVAEELDAFADTVAHDLKNPLSLITGYISYLAMVDPGEIGEDDYRDIMRRVDSNAHKMSEIIDALLLLAGVRKARAVKVGPLDMESAIGVVQEMLLPLITRTEGELIIPDDWPVAAGYQPWIEHVWANYISNALKYGGQPPRVELGYDVRDDGMVTFWVKDNGPGLTAEQQEQIFIPFTRVSDRKVEGHGLGLSIVQRIVTKLGGTIGVESAVGQGSVFSFTLPVVED